jgi:hypothetical protein
LFNLLLVYPSTIRETAQGHEFLFGFILSCLMHLEQSLASGGYNAINVFSNSSIKKTEHIKKLTQSPTRLRELEDVTSLSK